MLNDLIGCIQVNVKIFMQIDKNLKTGQSALGTRGGSVDKISLN